ncbi:MAG: polysaccharide deacetylase family protein [Vicinamibacterales bacterium]
MGKTMFERTVRHLVAAMWKRRRFHGLVVFTYHQVTPEFDPRFHLRGDWTSLSRFEAQLDFIRHYFEVLPLPEAVARWKSNRVRGLQAALTFDDGDISVRDHIVPTLQRRGLPATFFLNTAYGHGRGYVWYTVTNYLSHAAPEVRARAANGLLERAGQLRATDDAEFYDRTRREVEALSPLVDDSRPLFVDPGFLGTLDPQQFTVGLHGHEHERHSMMPAAWQRQNIERNMQVLRDLPNYTPLFAIPFGRPMDWDVTLARTAFDLDVDLITSNGGLNVQRDLQLRRIPADDRSVRDEFEREIVGW